MLKHVYKSVELCRNLDGLRCEIRGGGGSLGSVVGGWGKSGFSCWGVRDAHVREILVLLECIGNMPEVSILLTPLSLW